MGHTRVTRGLILTRTIRAVVTSLRHSGRSVQCPTPPLDCRGSCELCIRRSLNVSGNADYPVVVFVDLQGFPRVGFRTAVYPGVKARG